MAIIKKSGFGFSGRYRSGKLLRQVLGTTVYSWKPTPTEFMNKNSNLAPKEPEDVICCQTCDGVTVDNCVTYVYGGVCKENKGVPTEAAYIDCDYVV